MRLNLRIAAAAAAAFLVSHPVRAANTTEPWAQDALDVEDYAGFDGLGMAPAHQGVFDDFTVGYGVTDRLSASVGMRLRANGLLTEGEPALRLGLFANALHLDGFDLDLMLEAGSCGQGFSNLHVQPGTELNLDFERAGLYLRAALLLQGAPEGPTLRLDLTPGAYVRVAEGHRLLVEGLVSPAGAGVTLGYNVVLGPRLELITQVTAAQGSVGVLAGFIATLPRVR